MPTPAVRGPISTQVPQTQNTAPVIEFRCLYTRDLRRKAKRWQDGYLRYHTFNRRVMVYDTLRSYIGDTFNPSGADLQEGDELDLDKDFIMVQVSEPMGVTQTDVTQLMEQRNKHTDTTLTATPVRNKATQHSSGMPYQKHRSLTALLGTPKGPLGKAVISTLSPFEERQKRKAHDEHGAIKRQKLNHASLRPGKKCSAIPQISSPESSPLRHATVPQLKAQKKGPYPKQPDVIGPLSDTVADDDGISSSPWRKGPEATSEVGLKQMSALDRPSHVSTSVSAPARNVAPSSGGINATSPKRMPLKVISNAPRKMLLCQQTLTRSNKLKEDRPPTDTVSARLEAGVPGALEVIDEPRLAPHQQRLQDRLAKVGQKKTARTLVSFSADDENEDVPPRDLLNIHPARPTTNLASHPPVHPPKLPLNHPEIHPVSRAVLPAERPDNRPPKGDSHIVQPAAAERATAPIVAGRATTLKRPHDQGIGPPTRPRRLSLPGANDCHSNNSKNLLDATSKVCESGDGEMAMRVAPKQVLDTSAALKQPATRSLTRSESDPFGKPFKPLTRPPTRAAVQSTHHNKPFLQQSNDPLDFGPWSREAIDLFDWWPPDRDKQGNKITPVQV